METNDWIDKLHIHIQMNEEIANTKNVDLSNMSKIWFVTTYHNEMAAWVMIVFISMTMYQVVQLDIIIDVELV